MSMIRFLSYLQTVTGVLAGVALAAVISGDRYATAAWIAVAVLQTLRAELGGRFIGKQLTEISELINAGVGGPK